jgi:hypothetical protein
MSGDSKPYRKILQQTIFEYLDKYKEYPSRTVAALMHKDHPEIWATIEDARASVRYYRGAKGIISRREITKNYGFRKQI